MQDEALDIFKERIIECDKVCESFEYFLDEYVWIEDKVTKEAIDLKLWPAQREKIADLFLHRLLIILKAHQLGYTWIFVAAYCLWRAITEPLHHIVINSFNEDVGVEILKRVDFILDRLPEWMYPKIGQDNTQLKEFLHYDSEGGKVSSVIQVIPATEKGAQSKVPTILIIDESAQNRCVAKTYVASKPGIDTAQGQIIIISNSIKDAPGWSFTKDIYIDSIKGDNTFHRVFLPWWANPARPKNFREIQLNEGMDEEDFSQRYPETEEEAVSTILGSYFGKSLARHNYELTHEGLRGYLHKDKFNELEFVEDKHGVLTIWCWPYQMSDKWDGLYWENRNFIGSDVSEGVGQTYSEAYVLDAVSNQFVASLRSKWVDAAEWAKLLFDLSQYYRNADGPALICPERTGAGITTCTELMKMEAVVYFELIPAKVGPPTKRIGWPESVPNRHDICGNFRKWLRTTKGTVFHRELLDECSTFIRNEHGRLEAEQGKLDDCVFAAGCTIKARDFVLPDEKDRPTTVPEGSTGWLEKWQKHQL